MNPVAVSVKGNLYKKLKKKKDTVVHGSRQQVVRVEKINDILPLFFVRVWVE